ncbi:MAG: S9 family peptidase [Chloroflexia bacterium]
MAHRLTIEEVARFPRPGTAGPRKARFSPDGRRVVYLAGSGADLVQRLWAYEIESGKHVELAGEEVAASGRATHTFSREEELRRERSRTREVGITDYVYATDAEPPVLMIPSTGGLIIRVGDGPFVRLPGSEGNTAPQLSPDGTRVAYVREGELQVQATAGGEVTTVTQGAGEGITNGLAEFVAQEEMGRSEGFWWSPNGRYLAYERADARPIPIYPIVHQGKDAIDVEEHAYPFAGVENARVQLGVVSVEGGATTWMELGEEPDFYIARVGWTPDGTLTAQVQSRDQQTLTLVQFDRESGAATPVITEHIEPWINLSDDTRFLKSGEILWSSERSGFRHLYLYGSDGREVRQVTGGEWAVTRVVAVDEARRVVYFEGTRDGPLERHLYSVGLEGGEIRKLTSEPGWHETEVSPDFRRFVDSWSSLERAPTVALRETGDSEDAQSRPERVIFEQADVTPAALGFQVPELITVMTRDNVALDAVVYNPPEIEPGRRYPLIVSVYGGPGAQIVANLWGLTVDLRAQYLAQHGFVVLKVDNRGSANRGLGFEAPIAGNLGDIEVRDQVDAVRALAQRPHVDGERVGVYGWSYGGYMTLMALLRAPDVFRVGVAGAPVTHWEGYDTHYTERYMGLPQSNPEGYRRSAVLEQVAGLRGKLLLVHGMVDENVHFRHTAQLLRALAAAQKPYDLLLFPEERHMPRDAQGLEYQERRVLGYFEEHL